MKRMILCAGLLLICLPAFAHKASDSYLHLKVQDNSIQGQWDIALRDLNYAIGLDSNDDGRITWGELRSHQRAVAAYALSRLQVDADGASCSIRPTAHLVDQHSDGAYAVVRFTATCPLAPRVLQLRYSLFFDLDPLHRGLLRLEDRDSTRTMVFSPEHGVQQAELAIGARWRTFLNFGHEGVRHIWTGYDHLLFLVSLLLPAVLRREPHDWLSAASLRPVFWEVAKIVTAFTLAHSITLSLAALGIVSLPARWVESAIAASVALAALNNLFPVLHTRLWSVAFAFGLVHGLGFASVLLDLGLPAGARLLALVGFNLGVEAGQLAIVGIFLPIAFALRGSWFYRRVALQLGSLLIVGIALLWLAERSLDLPPLFSTLYSGIKDQTGLTAQAPY